MNDTYKQKITEDDIILKANESLDKLGNRVYPIDVLEIAKSYGLAVFSDINFSKNDSGFIVLNDTTGAYEIIINEYHPVVRKRFTLAHEIAHFLFDKDYLNIHKSIDRDGNAKDDSYRYREIIANKFAANLLMPQEEFIEKFLSNQSISEIADYFLVSKDTAKFRALNLGFIIS